MTKAVYVIQVSDKESSVILPKGRGLIYTSISRVLVSRAVSH